MSSRGPGRLRNNLTVLATAAMLILSARLQGASVGYWRFESDGGRAVVNGQPLRFVDDSSGHNRIGVPIGSPIYVNTPFNKVVPRTGAANHFAVRIGAQGGILFAGPAAKGLIGGKFTIEASIRLTSTPVAGAKVIFQGSRVVFALYDTGRGISNGLALYLHGVCVAKAPVKFKTGVNYDVAATYDGATAKLYVNGLPVATGAFPHFVGKSDGAATIGRGYPIASDSACFPGIIDEVRISDTAFLPAQLLDAQGVSLQADTTHPATGTFSFGEPVRLVLHVRGDKPLKKNLRVLIKIVGANGHLVRRESMSVAADAHGNWTAGIAAPSQRLGFYRVYVRLSDGVTLPRVGSRPAGYLTYCIVPDPAKRPFLPFRDSFFGISGTADADVLPYLGDRLVGGGCDWGQMEPHRAGQFAASLAAAKKAGGLPARLAFLRSQLRWAGSQNVGGSKQWKVYAPILSLYASPPRWATIAQTRGSGTAALTPEGQAAWAAYCRQVGRIFANRRGGWHIYQVTWEPDYPWGFKGTDAQLIRIYKIAYQALHATDPKAVVFGPTFGGAVPDVGATIRLLKEGLRKYLDGFSVHPYASFPPEKSGLVQAVRTIRRAIYKYTGKHLPMIGTEQGFSTDGHESRELDLAQGLVRENLIMLGEGFQCNYAFYLVDFPGGPGGDYGLYYNLTPHVAWYPDKVGPKPAAPAYAAMTFLLTGYRPVRAIQWLGGDTLGYAYRRGKEVILALWKYGAQRHSVSLPVGTRRVTVYDWMGNGHTVRSVGGTLKLHLTGEPTYVKGVSLAMWGNAAGPTIRFQHHHVTGYPGGRVTIIGELSSHRGRPVRGVITLAPDTPLGAKPMEYPVSLPAGGRQTFRYRLSIPAHAVPGSYGLVATLQTRTAVIGVDGVLLCIKRPLHLRVRPGFIKGTPALDITLADIVGGKCAGTLDLALRGVAGSSVEAPFHVEAGKSWSFIAALKGRKLRRARMYHAALVLAGVDGYRFTHSFPVNFWQAPYLHTALRIDGDLAPWRRVPPVKLRGRKWVVRSPQFYTGTADLSATARYAWNAAALYLAYKVHESTYCQPYTGYDTWRGDCLQLGFDLDPYKTVVKTGNLVADRGSRRRYSELTLALTKDGPQAYRTITFDRMRFPIGPIPAGALPLAVIHRGRSLVYEAAVPWTTLGARRPPRSGDCIGIAATINHINNPRQPDPLALGIFGGIYPSKNPGKFGILVLGSRGG